MALASRHLDIYDIASFEWVSVIEVAQIIAKLAGARVIPGELIGNTPITPIQGKVPGWIPEIDVAEGLARMVESARRQLASSRE